jgi:hypothetical protein
MMEALFLLVSLIKSTLGNRTAPALENLDLRQQLAILNRTHHKKAWGLGHAEGTGPRTLGQGAGRSPGVASDDYEELRLQHRRIADPVDFPPRPAARQTGRIGRI